QATQFYRSGRHLDSATAEPDNAVPLVAGKPLALRVYPDLERTRPGTGFLSVEGELTFQRPGTRRPARRAFPLNLRVFGQPAAAIDRGSADQTLNFLIPGEEARGRLLVRARVWAGLPGGGRRASRWFERTLEFIETRPLRLRLHGVRYRRDRLDLPAPSAVEAL